jgi:hypothetical protein
LDAVALYAAIFTVFFNPQLLAFRPAELVIGFFLHELLSALLAEAFDFFFLVADKPG